MPDYIYLLEHRLSADQQNALKHLREAAREAEMILFLTGDAVRDLTSGHAVRELEVAVHGNALKLKKPIEKLGGLIWGESESSHILYTCFPGTVRVDVVSTHRMDYTRIDKPVYHQASIQEDLRRRDFTVNAMAISLNEGSFGLLMDPLNGAADIEARTLRLVSNYGFLEEPSLLIRATRYRTRLGWDLDPKTQTRFENAKGEEVIEKISAEARSGELEQIGHEDEGLKVLRALEEEGWMKHLFPPWTAAKADEERLKTLHELAVELLMQGLHPDMSAAQMQLLTAKLGAKDLTALKQQMLRPGFVEEWNSLDAIAAKFAKVLLSKENSTASAGYKLFTTYDPEAVLWLGFTTKDKAVLDRYNLFLKVWPEAKQRIPHALMQEMRITPELAAYAGIVHALFLELIDGGLTTPEELRAFLEPHSPPAPPPQVTIKRPRAKRGEAKVKERAYDDEDEAEDGLADDEEIDDLGGDDDEIDLGLPIPKVDLDTEIGDDVEPDHESADDEVDDDEPEPPPAKRGPKGGGKPSQEPPAAAPADTKKGRKGNAPSAVANHAAPAPKPAAAKAPEPKTHDSVKAKTAAAAPAPVKPAVKQAPPPPVVKKETKTSNPVPAKSASKALGKAPVSKAAPAKPAHGPASSHSKAAAAAKGKAVGPAPKAVGHASKAGASSSNHGSHAAAAKSSAKAPAKPSHPAGKGKPSKPAPSKAKPAAKAAHSGKAAKPVAKARKKH